MGRGAISAAVLSTCAALYACRPADAAKTVRADSAELAKREQRLEQALGLRDSTALPDSTVHPRDSAATAASDSNRAASHSATATSDSTAGAIARWILPRDLDEISGITLTSDRRLLTHGDERAQVSEIDYRRGVITKQFVVGRPTIRADLEGIAAAHDALFLLGSNGMLYEFREGANGTRVDYITSDTHLGKECEFEGLAFDPAINSLLLACKTVEQKHLRDSMVIYRWRLQGGAQRLSKLAVPLAPILKAIGEKELHPSDIAVDPKTGNYLLIASIEKAMVEITPAGGVVLARKLAGQHTQPESIAITSDGILIIGDEAGRRPAVLTLYRWPL